MPDMPQDPVDAARDQFLIEKYRSWTDSMHRSEEQGDRRLGLFVTLAAAVIAGLGALFTSARFGKDPLSILPLARWSVAGLLVLGLLNFLRVLKRNEATDESLAEMHAIERRFREGRRGWPLEPIVVFRARDLGDGGLASVALWLNTAVTGALVALLASERGAVAATVLSAISMLAIAGAQWRYMKTRPADALKRWEKRRKARLEAERTSAQTPR